MDYNPSFQFQLPDDTTDEPSDGIEMSDLKELYGKLAAVWSKITTTGKTYWNKEMEAAHHEEVAPKLE